MGNVIVGATLSLDGFMSDRHGDVSRLYPDLEAVRRTEMLMACAAYGQIKINLSRCHPDDVDFYYDIKDPLCDIIINAAEDWVRATDWQMALSPE